MVHLRNDEAGLCDCDPKAQYHNRHFRDLAVLAGLACDARHRTYGYAFTDLDERGREVVRQLQPNLAAFCWAVVR